MIPIKELRLGNHVWVDQTICTVTLLHEDPMFADGPCVGYEGPDGHGFRCVDDPALEGIALSDELLGRLAYVFHPHFKLWQHPKKPGTFSMELDRDHTALDFGHRTILKEIASLHTLQNLYFLLSGEELVLAGAPRPVPNRLPC
ncbi:hypothetical protein [Flaviaesturariibacter aridisoli]|uniref:Uncharacterized protein n=1 Tax=Flaviaesturariibacter aridisoli TaxID=2545761 RepID=A0A4R4DTI9_9BACT|nr:hypothetical protein [Flaviaesturariibacter aridisoli]TCZ63421.1 hypothetical protein E0486_18670 [Flaviaesturariibacter aridisoli]